LKHPNIAILWDVFCTVGEDEDYSVYLIL